MTGEILERGRGERDGIKQKKLTDWFEYIAKIKELSFRVNQ